MKQTVVLYGTGIEGEKFYWKWKDLYEIEFCIDMIHRRSFHGNNVYNISEIKDKLKGKFIVIAAKVPYRFEMEEQLKKIGLKEHKNYIFSEYLGRKLAIMYGNCHMQVIEKYMNFNPEFKRQYYIKVFLVFKRQTPSIEDLRHADLFVGQDIRRGKYVSTEELKKQLSNTCKVYVIPNLYGINLFFPQERSTKELEMMQKKLIMKHFTRDAIYFEGEDYNKLCLDKEDNVNVTRYLGCDDYNINSSFVGLSVEEIKNKIENEDVYEESEIIDAFRKEIKKLKEREKNCNVEISDYILNNYQERQLFYDPRHPVEELICEKARRILRMLEIEIIEYNGPDRSIDYEETYIYGCVKRALGTYK